MRIITIRRNSEFLIKTLNDSSKDSLGVIEKEIQELMSLIKKIEQRISYLSIKEVPSIDVISILN
jgi:hypothetical protein